MLKHQNITLGQDDHMRLPRPLLYNSSKPYPPQVVINKINHENNTKNKQNKIENISHIKEEMINLIKQELKNNITYNLPDEPDWYHCEDDKDDDTCAIDKVQIFGTDGEHILPVLTDSKGRIKISSKIIIPPISFKEIVIQNIQINNYFEMTRSFDLSQKSNVSFVVVNKGSNPVSVQLRISPNDSIYKVDVPEMEVDPFSFEILTPTRFIRFAKIAYRSTLSGQPSCLDIFIQAQGNKKDD